MERIKNTNDEYKQKIRPGTTWVAGFTQPGNNDDLRSIDSDGAEMRFTPASRYYAAVDIKRGQAVSIAQLSDLTTEQAQNKFAYVKITDPDIDETCLGIAMNYAKAGQIVQIQSTGKFNYYTTDSILCTDSAKAKEIFLNADGWNFESVRGQKLFIKKLTKNTTTSADRSDLTDGTDQYDTAHEAVSSSADENNWFTYDFIDSVYTAKNTIQIGTLTDAPTTNKNKFIYSDGKYYQKLSDGTKVEVTRDVAIVEKNSNNEIVLASDVTISSTGIKLTKGSKPPKAHEAVWLQKTAIANEFIAVDDLVVTVELDITGDTRGPIDNTQFIMTLGESIYFDTEKKDETLTAPDFNQGIYDELKVVSLATGNPSGPCFRFFVTQAGIAAYVKAEKYVAGTTYYGRYPGNVYKEIENATAASFNNTYIKTSTYVDDTIFYTYNESTKKYTAVELTVQDFSNAREDYYYKVDYYVAADKLNNAFISVRKIDGDTYIIPVLCDFTKEDLASGAALIDANDEGYYRLSTQFAAGVKQDYYTKATTYNSSTTYYKLSNGEFSKATGVSSSNVTNYYILEQRSPKITVGDPIQTITMENLKASIYKALQSIFVDDETRVTGCTPVSYDIGAEGFQVTTNEIGGHYDVYISSSLLGMVTCTQAKHGQSAEAGTVVLADIRDSDRSNVLGVVLSNQSGVHKKGDTVKIMKMGRITTYGNLSTGMSYYLGLNGRLSTRSQYWYDRCVPVGVAESSNCFIVDVSQNPQHSYSGNLPLGYLKPSVYGSAEKGYLLADGKTIYNKDEYPELYNLLLNWFDAEELKPSNVTEDLYNKYENWSLSEIFQDIFEELTYLRKFSKLAEIDSVENLRQTHEADVETINTAIKTTNTNLSTLETKHNTDKAEIKTEISTLGTKHDNEVKDLKTLVNSNKSDVDETTAGLQTQISNLKIEHSKDVADISTKISTETTNREKADKNLSDSLTSVETEYKAADAKINNTITALTKTVEGNKTDLTSKIANNTSAISTNVGDIDKLENTISTFTSITVKPTTVFADRSTSSIVYKPTDLDNAIVSIYQADQNLNKDSNASFNSLSTTGNVTIGGSLSVTGTMTTVHQEEINTSQDFIKLRDGAATGLTSYSGLEIENYDGETHTLQIVTDKDGVLRIGVTGSTLEPLLTRSEENDLSNGSLLMWDAENVRAVDSGIAYGFVATKDDLNSMQVNFTSGINDAKKTLTTQYESLKSDFDELKTNYETLQSSYEALENKYDGLVSQIQDIYSKLDSKDSKDSKDSN